MKKIQLPKGYLSYSQLTLWQADPERYKLLYFEGRDELRSSNKAMDYGKVVADALENANETGDLMTDTAMSLLIKYDIADKEITTTLKTKDVEIPLIGRPDTMDSKTFAFREYKTGRIKWTAKRAQNHLQMKFYAVLIFLEHKKTLKEAHLDWIETVTEEGIVKPTGHIESFRVTFSLTDILDTMALITRIAKEIEVAWTSYVPKPEIPF
jgi:hypothetical protein